MASPLFTVSVRELERAEQRRRFELPLEWLDWAFAETEAKSDGQPGTLEVHLKKNGREVLVKGTARAHVTMPCARTLDPVPVELTAEILLLLSPRAPAPVRAGGRKARRERPSEPAETAGSPQEESLSSELAARDEYDGDHIELDGFVREYLLLELPLFPLRSDLPFDPTPATDPRPNDRRPAAPGDTVDPRLLPLAALASQFKKAE
ncbi:MAG TPA: YceD family protein [Polyangiaceae bacterium]|nr:YceD family protein [Polyangiaceae bacterium]